MIDVDTLLGDHRTRYFGDGHKKTSYSIGDLVNGRAYGKITHEDLWSKKQNKEIQPHLSTLDGVILASLVAEKYLSQHEYSVENFYLMNFEIKSGMKPIEDLEKVLINLKKAEVNSNKAFFEVSVLDMKVKVTFRLLYKSYEVTYDSMKSKNYLSNHLKDVKHNVYDVSFLETLDTADKCSIYCKANKISNQYTSYSGISSSYIENYSILELLIIFSQMAEMLAYHVDDIDRECSETLWMKNVSAELTDPIPSDEIALLGKITKSKSLDMKGKNWKIFEMSGTDTKNRIKISSKIAHQLPESEAKFHD
ncbi:AvrD family protein [Streptococcus orisasini]